MIVDQEKKNYNKFSFCLLLYFSALYDALLKIK